MTTGREFRRALLGLNAGVTNAAALDVTTRIADALGLDLLGLYFLDDALTQLALYTGMREFSLTAGAWRIIDPKRLRGEQEAAVRQAERLFTTKASPSRTRRTFKVVADRTPAFIVSESTSSDIIVVAEPCERAGLAAGSFPALYGAAVRSKSAVLLIPRTVLQRRGPVVAIAFEPDDRSLRMAETIAAAAGERLVVIEAFAAKRARPPEAPQASGVPTRTITAGPGSRNDPHVLAATLGSLAESLIVATHRVDRGHNGDFAIAIATIRRVPVLLLEPPEETG